MLVGKWWNFALSIVGGLAASASAVDWTPLGQKGAGIAATAIFVIKGLINIAAPAAGASVQAVPGASAASLVSHN